MASNQPNKNAAAILDLKDQEAALRKQKSRHQKSADAAKEKALAFQEDDEMSRAMECMREAKAHEANSQRLDSQLAMMMSNISLLQDQNTNQRTAVALVAAARESDRNVATLKKIKMDDVHETLYNGVQSRDSFHNTMEAQASSSGVEQDDDELVEEMQRMATKRLQRQINTVGPVPTSSMMKHAPLPPPRQPVNKNAAEDAEIAAFKLQFA